MTHLTTCDHVTRVCVGVQGLGARAARRHRHAALRDKQAQDLNYILSGIKRKQFVFGKCLKYCFLYKPT